MIQVRLVKHNQFFTGLEHQDVDITDLAFWEPPGGGWLVSAISNNPKGLPPWEDEPQKPATGPGVEDGTRGNLRPWRYHFVCGHSRVVSRDYVPKQSGYSMTCTSPEHRNGPVLRNVLQVTPEPQGCEQHLIINCPDCKPGDENTEGR